MTAWCRYEIFVRRIWSARIEETAISVPQGPTPACPGWDWHGWLGPIVPDAKATWGKLPERARQRASGVDTSG